MQITVQQVQLWLEEAAVVSKDSLIKAPTNRPRSHQRLANYTHTAASTHANILVHTQIKPLMYAREGKLD